jgi:cytochrome oxidase Cu insertion factor (SCO1/SenC/PrrC family)
VDEQTKSRRKLIATLTVVLPILAGIVIVAAGHFFGHETKIHRPQTPTTEPRRRSAALPAATGTPSPRVRLTEGATGKSFDSASLDGAPYAVVFVSTRCEAIGDLLGRAAGELQGEHAAILAITADPRVDSPAAVRAWSHRHHIKAGGSVHYLVGAEDEVRGYWDAWGFSGPTADCPESLSAHLVSGKGVDSGVIDLQLDASPSLMTGTLTGLSR